MDSIPVHKRKRRGVRVGSLPCTSSPPLSEIPLTTSSPAAAVIRQAEVLKAETSRLEREVGHLYRDKSRLLEDVVALGADLAAARQHAQGLAADLDQVGTCPGRQSPEHLTLVCPRTWK